MKHWSVISSLAAIALLSHALTATAESIQQPKNQPKPAQSLVNVADTYLAAAAENGAARWPEKRVPITYHIDDKTTVPGYRPGFKRAVEAAMNAWSNATGGKISFSPVDANNAALQIAWTDDVKKMNFSSELGHTEVVCDGDGVVSANMLLLTKQVDGAAINDGFAKHVAMHELGHALGILGHSPNADDVMYASTTPAGSASLSKKDINTMLALYSPAGDSFAKKMDAVKMTDVGPNASPALQAMHLNAEADEALNKMQYALAIEKLEQAHKVDPTNQVVMTNLGSTYGNVAAMAVMMQKPKDAENYFKKSIAILEMCKSHAALIPILTNYSTVLKATNRVAEGIKLDARIRQLSATPGGK